MITVDPSSPWIQTLIKLAQEDCSGDENDFNVYDWSGGNYDDAYSLGIAHQEVWSARETLTRLGIKWYE